MWHDPVWVDPDQIELIFYYSFPGGCWRQEGQAEKVSPGPLPSLSSSFLTGLCLWPGALAVTFGCFGLPPEVSPPSVLLFLPSPPFSPLTRVMVGNLLTKSLRDICRCSVWGTSVLHAQAWLTASCYFGSHSDFVSSCPLLETLSKSSLSFQAIFRPYFVHEGIPVHTQADVTSEFNTYCVSVCTFSYEFTNN